MADCPMVGECSDIYEFRELPDGSAEVYIRVPARFRELWLIKLDELRATDEEIAEHEPKA